MNDEAIGALHAKGGLCIALSSRQPLLFLFFIFIFWQCDRFLSSYCVFSLLFYKCWTN